MSSIKLPRPIPPLSHVRAWSAISDLMSGPVYGIGSSSRTVTAGCASILDRNWGTKNSDLISREPGIPFRRVATCRGSSVPTNPVPLPHHNKQSSPPVVDLARQSRFQVDDDGDLHEQILHIEAHIEELTDIIERCRKIILFSKVAVAAGGILILATIIGAVGFDPAVLIGAIAAVIGGTVVFGSNTSTLKQTMIDMKAADAHRTELISRMDLKVVGDGEVEN